MFCGFAYNFLELETNKSYEIVPVPGLLQNERYKTWRDQVANATSEIEWLGKLRKFTSHLSWPLPLIFPSSLLSPLHFRSSVHRSSSQSEITLVATLEEKKKLSVKNTTVIICLWGTRNF